MLKGLLIGILCYSFVLLIFNIYKDNSSYDMIDWPDMVIGGPCCWVFMLICFVLIRPIYKKIRKNRQPKKKEYKPKSEKYIQKTIEKFIDRNRKYYSYNKILFDFSRYSGGEFAWNNIEGWDKLFVRGRKNARLNDKVQSLMFNQEDDAMPILLTYFTPVTEDYLQENEFDSYTIDLVRDSKETIYRIKD